MRNIARWVEYSFSSTIMIVLITLINGIWNLLAILAIAGCNISMILFGWLQEKYEEPGKGGLLPSGSDASPESFLGLQCSGYFSRQ